VFVSLTLKARFTTGVESSTCFLYYTSLINAGTRWRQSATIKEKNRVAQLHSSFETNCNCFCRRSCIRACLDKRLYRQNRYHLDAWMKKVVEKHSVNTYCSKFVLLVSVE